MRYKPQIISVFFDLSSQKESVAFMKNYADFCKKCGYNTLILGLNATVRTSVSSYFNVDDSYSMEEMKEFVDYIHSIGLDAVPAFENMGHIDKFLSYEENKSFAEFENEKEQARGWLGSAFSPRGQVGCMCKPKLFDALDSYIREVCSIFKSKYVHMCMDEIFEFAECDTCRKMLKDTSKTKKQLFLDLIMHNYNLVRSMNKEMMMWTDFFEYYDVTESLPRDIILCHWDYYFIGYEPRGKWTGRIQKDWLRIFDELGFRYIFCSKSMETSSAFNIETLTRYADKYKPFGAMMTTWEKSAIFYECNKPSLAYAGKLWTAEENEKIDRTSIYADFLNGDRELAVLLNSLYEPEIVTGYFDVTNIAERRHHVIDAYLAHLKYLLGEFEKRNVSIKNGGNEVLCDIYDNLSERYAKLSLSALGDYIFDDYEKDGITDLDYYDKIIDEAESYFTNSKGNADILWERYRKSIVSCGNAYDYKYKSFTELAEKIRTDIHEKYGKRYNVLGVELMLPDTYSIVKGEFIVKYRGEAEKTIYSGNIKTELTMFDVSGVYSLCLRLENKDIEYLIFNSFGEGEIFPVHFSYTNGNKKFDAKKVIKLYGEVKNEQNVLSFDVSFAEMGYGNGEAHINDMHLATVKHGIKLYF